MSKEFAVDKNGMTADGYCRLEPVSKVAMYIGNAISFLICVVVFGLLVHFSDRIFKNESNLASMCLIAIFVIISIYLIVGPIVFYRRYRYRIDDDKAEIRRGIITIRHTLVPIERIHQVEVTRGPINRQFGLADVNITTAGGTTKIEYLRNEVAEDIASKLNECVVKLLKDRE